MSDPDLLLQCKRETRDALVAGKRIVLTEENKMLGCRQRVKVAKEELARLEAQLNDQRLAQTARVEAGDFAGAEDLCPALDDLEKKKRDPLGELKAATVVGMEASRARSAAISWMLLAVEKSQCALTQAKIKTLEAAGFHPERRQSLPLPPLSSSAPPASELPASASQQQQQQQEAQQGRSEQKSKLRSTTELHRMLQSLDPLIARCDTQNQAAKEHEAEHVKRLEAIEASIEALEAEADQVRRTLGEVRGKRVAMEGPLLHMVRDRQLLRDEEQVASRVEAIDAERSLLVGIGQALKLAPDVPENRNALGDLFARLLAPPEPSLSQPLDAPSSPPDAPLSSAPLPSSTIVPLDQRASLTPLPLANLLFGGAPANNSVSNSAGRNGGDSVGGNVGRNGGTGGDKCNVGGNVSDGRGSNRVANGGREAPPDYPDTSEAAPEPPLVTRPRSREEQKLYKARSSLRIGYPCKLNIGNAAPRDMWVCWEPITPSAPMGSLAFRSPPSSTSSSTTTSSSTSSASSSSASPATGSQEDDDPPLLLLHVHNCTDIFLGKPGCVIIQSQQGTPVCIMCPTEEATWTLVTTISAQGYREVVRRDTKQQPGQDAPATASLATPSVATPDAGGAKPVQKLRRPDSKRKDKESDEGWRAAKRFAGMAMYGAAFMKHGRKGGPKQRNVSVSVVQTTGEHPYIRLEWGGSRVMELKRGMQPMILPGKQTQVLQRHTAGKADWDSCFSIVTSTASLDLEAADRTVAREWIEGLGLLVLFYVVA